jgi:hypothetical protein
MRRILLPAVIAGAVIASIASISTTLAANDAVTPAKFAADGQVMIPQNYRSWIFVGTPLTPNALNNGEAPFQEFHNVYVEPSAFEHFKKTGEWANGTQLVKELVLIHEGDDCAEYTGACFEVSGNGYFQGEFAGLEVTVKDTERFPDEPGGSVYYSFGHIPPPYAELATAFPAETCNACHESSADTDFVFTQFYPVLRAAMPK